MAKLTVSPISSTNNTTPAVNKAIQKLVSELNDKVLYRKSPLGEPNSMSNDLDMGDNDILNAGLITCQSLIVAGSTEIGDSGEAVLNLVATINQLEDDVDVLQATDVNFGSRIGGLEADHLNFDGRLAIAEATLSTQDTTIDTLVTDVDTLEVDVAEIQLPKVLSTLNTANVPLTTTPTIISGNTDIVTCSCIERLVDGSIRYNRAGSYIVTFTFKVATTSNIEVYFWVEKWNGAAWDIVPYSGITREMPSLRESEISASYIRSVDVDGEIYCIMGSAASNSGAVLSADILPSGATMPSIRIDIRGK
jgi:hypothetical protein